MKEPDKLPRSLVLCAKVAQFRRNHYMPIVQSIFADVTCPRCHTMIRQLEIDGEVAAGSTQIDGHAQCPMCKNNMTVDLTLENNTIVGTEVKAARMSYLMAS